MVKMTNFFYTLSTCKMYSSTLKTPEQHRTLWHRVQASCSRAPCLTQVLLWVGLLGWHPPSMASWVQFLSMIDWNTCVPKIQLVNPHDPNMRWWDRCTIAAIETCSETGEVGGARQPRVHGDSEMQLGPVLSSCVRAHPHCLEVIFLGTQL